ncbi:hypothetical protein JCM19368_20850 [Halomonas shantousis]
MSPDAWLHDGLLGEPVTQQLAWPVLEEDIRSASTFHSGTLLRLLTLHPDERSRLEILESDILLSYVLRIAKVFHLYGVEGGNLDGSVLQGKSFEHWVFDYSAFVMLARLAAEHFHSVDSCRLEHLLGLVAIRYKLETHVRSRCTICRDDDLAFGGRPVRGLPIGRPDMLTIKEIAAVSGLKLATVRNAISRREMAYQRPDGVPCDDAMNWLMQRSGFRFMHAGMLCVHQRTNGKVASEWLANCDAVERISFISRLRLEIWRTRHSGRMFAINAHGIRHCSITLPETPSAALLALAIEQLQDRSDEPAARLYREAFASDGVVEALWQFQISSLDVLKAMITILDSNMPQSAELVCNPQELPRDNFLLGSA